MVSDPGNAVLAVLTVVSLVTGAFVVTTEMGPRPNGPGGAAGPSAQQQQQQPNRCLREGTTLLVKFEAQGEDLLLEGQFGDDDLDSEGASANGVTVFNVSVDDDDEPVSFNWTSTQQIAYVQVFGGRTFQNYSNGGNGFVEFGTMPAISNVIFCVPTTPTDATPTESTPTEPTPTEVTPTEATPTEPTPTETTPTGSTPTESTPTETTPTETIPTEPTQTQSTPTETTQTETTPTESTPTETTQTESTPSETPQTRTASPTDVPTQTPTDTPPPTDTQTPTPELDVLYWQVDFGVGETPPQPPYYRDQDLVAALGNSEDGVTENPSYSQQERAGQLQNVTVVGGSFTFDDPADPASVTVRFRLAEGSEPRTLHLATFVLPGPFEYAEIDEQGLFDAASVRIGPGETKSLTVEIPQPSDVSNSLPAWAVGAQLFGVGAGSFAILLRRRDPT